jgi:hypothetical protein
MFNVINDEQQKEKHAANQFFSSLLGDNKGGCTGALQVVKHRDFTH